MTKAVFFDFDGVLVDSMPAHVAAWRDELAEIGVTTEETYFQKYEGEKAEDTVARLCLENNLKLEN